MNSFDLTKRQKGQKKKPTTQGYSVINLHFKTALFAKPAY